MEPIKQKTALITGGTKGIGLGIAEAMLHEGMNVLRNQAGIDEAMAKLNAINGGEAAGVVADVRNYEHMENAVTTVIDKWGKLDVLIANAGVGHFAPIAEMTHEQWNETIDINLTGVFNTVKSSLSSIKESKGYIITIASLAGTNFFPTGTAYNASKFGLVGFTQALMLDVRNDGINTSTIMPGSVATNFNHHKPSDSDSWKIQPEDIGQMVVDLLKLDPRTLPSKIEVRPSQIGK